MAALTWDETGKHFYDTGLDRGVLYVWDPTASKYAKGVAWSGLTKVTDKPTGAEITKLYADNIPYLSMISAEEFEETIEAYIQTLEQIDGSALHEGGIEFRQAAQMIDGATNNKDGVCRIALRRH